VGKKTINILLANDHILLINGISSIFEKHAPHIKIIGEAENFIEVLNILSHKKADILMIDDIMPYGDISTLLPIVKEQYPELKIIINSMCDNSVSHVKKTIELVDGWVGLYSNEQEYIKAVETVYSGKHYFIKGFEKEELAA